jgi:hypothetical protein
MLSIQAKTMALHLKKSVGTGFGTNNGKLELTFPNLDMLWVFLMPILYINMDEKSEEPIIILTFFIELYLKRLSQ